jgi:hypothetical protein
MKDYICGLCGEEFRSNCDAGDIACVNCEARLCPCCGAWFDEAGNSSQDLRDIPALRAELEQLRAKLAALAAKWEASANRNRHNGQRLLDQGDECGSEGLAVAEALGACHAELIAVFSTPEAKPAADREELRTALANLADRAEASRAITGDEADEYRKLAGKAGGS